LLPGGSGKESRTSGDLEPDINTQTKMSATETITNAQGLISSAEASEELLSKSTSSGRAALSNKLTHVDELVKVPQLDMDLPQAVPNLREQLADLLPRIFWRRFGGLHASRFLAPRRRLRNIQ
jgi:hypothetical protein